MNFFSRHFQNNRFVRAASVLAGANLGGQILMIAITPILVRIYSPEMFGLFAAWVALTNPIAVLSCFRYEIAIPTARSCHSAITLAGLSFTINAAVSMAVFLVLMVAAKPIATVFGLPDLLPLLWLMPAAILAMGTYRICNFLALRCQAFKVIGTTKICQSLSMASVQLGLGLSGLGAIGLGLGLFASHVAGIIGLSRANGLRQTIRNTTFKASRLKRVMFAYRRFSLIDVPATVMNMANTQLPPLLFAVLFGPVSAGYFYLADRLVAVPLSLIGMAVGQVFFSLTSNISARYARRRYPVVIVLALGAVVSIPTLVLANFGPDIFALILGETWRQAGVYTSWLIFGIALQFIYAPISTIFLTLQAQHLAFSLHMTMAVFKAAVLFYAASLGDVMLAVQGITLVSCVGYATGIMTVLFLVHQERQSRRRQVDRESLVIMS